jgi:hypothetical protein
MSIFFFYHNLKHEHRIKSLNIPCTIENGTIMVDSYNEKSGHLTLGTTEIVDGKLVSFNAPIQTVLTELNKPSHQIGLGKPKYEITKTMVNVNNQLKEAFIIV